MAIEWSPRDCIVICNYGDAVLYAASVDIGGFRWRLPTYDEVRSRPAVITVWSSDCSETHSHTVDLYGGSINITKTYLYAAWPVRDILK